MAKSAGRHRARRRNVALGRIPPDAFVLGEHKDLVKRCKELNDGLAVQAEMAEQERPRRLEKTARVGFRIAVRAGARERVMECYG